MELGTAITAIVAVGEFVALCFLTPMVGRISKIEDKLTEMDKKLKTDEQLEAAIDLKIYRHMGKCAAHQAAAGAYIAKTQKFDSEEIQ